MLDSDLVRSQKLIYGPIMVNPYCPLGLFDANPNHPSCRSISSDGPL